ncbi:MAG: Wzz/FepE/Etk N-terminal domain-containing protein [Sulfurovum sp.]|nr:Wzz/FepE/Etk N-terminal domain-containing protein [Sulfurovum sp.]
MTQENNKIEDDTIDLRELFFKLKKRKNIIISIVIIFTLLAILYAFFIAKPVYSVKAVIEIGILDDEPIDDINSVQQKLSYLYKVNTKGIKHTLPLVKSITASKKIKKYSLYHSTWQY